MIRLRASVAPATLPQAPKQAVALLAQRHTEPGPLHPHRKELGWHGEAEKQACVRVCVCTLYTDRTGRVIETFAHLKLRRFTC